MNQNSSLSSSSGVYAAWHKMNATQCRLFIASKKEHGKMPGMWQLNWLKAALSVYTWCCHHVLFLNRLFTEQMLNKAFIRRTEVHRLTLSGRDPHCETCAAPARTPQCPVLPTSSIPSPRETEKSSFAAELIKACIVLLTQNALLFQGSLCCCTIVSWAVRPLWGSVFTVVTSMNTIQWLKSRYGGRSTPVTQEDAISNYSGCDSSQTIFVLRTRCAALRQTNVRRAAPRRMTAVAFLDMIPNHTYDTIRLRDATAQAEPAWVCGSNHI